MRIPKCSGGGREGKGEDEKTADWKQVKQGRTKQNIYWWRYTKVTAEMQ